MKKYKCPTCDYVYDPEIGDIDAGISPGTSFEDLPDLGMSRLRRA